MKKQSQLDMRDVLQTAWETNNRVNIFLIEHLPPELWEAKLPGIPRKTFRTLCCHLHNVRCSWIKVLGEEFSIKTPQRIDKTTATPKQLASALQLSGAGIASLLDVGCDHNGVIPTSSAYVWRNLPLDVTRVLTYFVAHEAHHRGQIVILARQSGHPLPKDVADGLWQWTKLSKNPPS
jgi:uncharacterized damage-inducible protein DinB